MKGKLLEGLARSLRRNQTEAEKKLWYLLRSRQILGVKFRRQQPFGLIFWIFVLWKKGIVIELDGGHHAQKQEKDIKRTEFLMKEGFRVIRIWNDEVLKNIEGVLEYLLKQIQKSPSPRPSPLKGEGVKS